ncbi:SNF2-related domain-containing protein [Cavenderia fasciculata]|uniref:SNF2-related domain-containing protein n=1 Tax=Cavenderia fasciculata TaxID=261658 RepID=F4Q797_CACFS|nr:SNF2-related domain-containing protein [Cavenderia fasciculata]EGG16279.1 SNF2-related domain-containing protein [Cavenderia fasciculata]|eukprot:XP_004354663.1 SNF2-related domain-containing protein [Cavenderia fasciculata]
MSPSLASFDDNSSSVSIEDLSIAQKKDNVLHNLINALKVLKSKGVSEYNEQYQSLLQLIQLYSSNKISIKGTDIAYSIGNGVVESETVTAASAAAAVAAAQPKVVSTISEVVEEDIDMNDTQTTSTTSTTTSTSGGDVDMMTNEDDEEQTTTNKLDEELRLKANQIPIFKAQLEAFKYLSRNLPIPSNTLSKISNLLEYEPKEEFDDLKFYSKGSIKTDNLNQPNPDIPETYKGLYEAVQSIHEREERIASKIQYRIEELKDLPSTIQPELKTRSLIEMKQLKVCFKKNIFKEIVYVLNVQKKVRNDILSELNEDIFINSVDNIDIFVKPIPRETFKSGEMMYEGSTSQQNVESIFTVNRKKFLSAVLNHHKEFSEFHSKKEKQTKNALKLIHRFHLEKERREQERLRKERIRLLKLQDTEGYRDLLAKTKNDRLEMLMSQTDSLLSKIDFLVQKEKVEQEERAEKEREEREEKEKLDLIANANTPPSSNNQVDGSSTEEKKDGVATEGGDKTQWFNAPFTGGSSAKQPKSHISVNEEESLIIINRLHQVLRYFLLRRLKKDVESQLPEKKERVIKCNLSAMQIVMYRSIAEYGQLPIDPTSEMFKKSKTGMRGFNNTLKQMQKICNHPYLFLSEWDINEDLIRASGKFDMMDQILLKMKASGHRVLIFTQMTEVINLMGEYFSLKEWDYLRLDGSTKPEERSRLVVEWNRKDSPFFIFVLSTHAGGLGMNLQTADTVIIFDSDWNPQMDLQAQDRCHRVGQVNRVNVFRLISANSIEEKILERATDKLEIDAKIIQAGMFNTHSNDQERRAKLEEFLHGFPANTAEEATTDLEEINRLIARDDEELIQFQAIDKEAARIETLKNKGVKKQHKSRLIIESELPEWLMRSPVAEDKEPLGARKRTTLNNLPMDDLTEIQWERMMELGMSLPEFKEYLANKKKKRVDLKKGSSAKKSTPKRKRKDSESDSEEEDDGYYSDSLLMSDSEDITVTPTNDQEMDQDGEEKEKEKTSTTSTATTPAHTPGKRGRPPKRASSAAITSPPEKKKPAAVTKRQRNAGAADTTTTEDEEETNGVASDVSVSNDDQPMSPTQSSRRKRLSFTPKTLASPVAAASDDATPENGTPYKPRRASTRGSASVKKESQQQQPNGDAHDATNNNNTTESSSSAEKPNDEIFQGIIEKIKRIKEKTRKVSELFWDLPSRSDYPDYFKVIKNPISMNEISQGSYKTPELFVSDWKLMFNNALTYNDPDSQVYRDAITLYDILATEVKSHFESVIIPPLSKV